MTDGDPSLKDGSMRGKAFGVVASVASVIVTVGALIAGSATNVLTSPAAETTLSSSTEVQSVTTSSLTISAVVSPISKPLYPGANGNVVVTISNPNAYPVTVTAVSLPSSATFATGYTASALTMPQIGCLATSPSDVAWSYSAVAHRSSHILAKPLTVAASGQPDDPLTVTFINDASMTVATPASCEGTYFSMPPITGVTDIDGPTTVTTSPTTDRWTS